MKKLTANEDKKKYAIPKLNIEEDIYKNEFKIKNDIKLQVLQSESRIDAEQESNENDFSKRRSSERFNTMAVTRA